ncbi:hypothetical protein AB6A40_002458 [Gnathostoma spinigerum]|uniref:Structural maintenance of chromosomes protein n=1 Tax=Gnathostoma spinigerum TaxID=75299 RepID=A0ABD6E6N1_9BILA
MRRRKADEGQLDSELKVRRRRDGKGHHTGGMNSDGRSLSPDDNRQEEDLRAQVRDDIDEENLLGMEIPDLPEPLMNADGTGKRLMITYIDVENFKSYYGKQIIGPFHQNFTCIVGPNGSGKSNVIDALLFVFGYRASKIRSKKISVLIHSSAGHDNIQCCSVGVNFQQITDLPDGSYQVIPNSQFTVTRTAYKDNSSRYAFNGRNVQFKEIAKLLREVGIDLIHNRFLILQGEVEQIAMMKPKALSENDDGMLEYLEDIIGSSRLKVPIEKLQQKIESLQEDRSAQLTRVRLAEKEKNEAEGPVQELINRLRIDNGIVLLNNRLYQMERLEVSNVIEEQEKAVQAVETELCSLNSRRDELKVKIADRKKMHAQLQKNLENAQEAYEKTKAELANLEEMEKKREAELKRFSAKEKKLEEDISKEEKILEKLEKLPSTAKAKIEEHRVILTEMEALIDENNKEKAEKLAEFDGETVELKAKKKVLEEGLSKLNLRLDEASSKLTLAQEELHNLRSEEESERRKVSDLRSDVDRIEDLLNTKGKELENAKHFLPGIEKELGSKKMELASLRDKEGECADEVRNDRSKFENARQTMETFRSQNNIVARLMREKAAGRIPGIFGRLGDLGAIDKKYDVAVSTTCGALDFIVVDNIDTAQICVEFLKKERLGLATFIALDQQEKHRSNMVKLSSTPENIPRVFDLINVVDESVLPAFYFAFRDTLVAEDITQATRVGLQSHQRRRVITLKGEVVEPSGTMTGGGRSEKRGRIGQKVKVDSSKDFSKELVGLEKRLKLAEERLVELRRSIQEVENRISVLQSDRDKVKQNERNASIAVETLQAQLRSLKERLANQEKLAKETVADSGEVERVTKKVATQEEARNAARDAVEEVSEQVDEISRKIQAVYDRLVGPYQTTLDDAQKRKDEAVKGIAKEQSALNSAERNMSKSKCRKNDLETDLRMTQEKIKQHIKDASGMKEKIEELCKSKIEEEGAVRKCEGLFKEVMDVHSELDTEDIELRKQVDDVQRKMQEIRGSLKHHRTKADSIDAKIKHLHLTFVRALSRLPENLRANGEDDDQFLLEAVNAENDFCKRLEARDERVDDDEVAITVNDLPVFAREDIERFDKQQLNFNLLELEKRKSSQTFNLGGLQDYVVRLERYEREMEGLVAISKKREKHRQFYEKLRQQRMNEFMDGFSKIGTYLKDMYQMITLGGDACLDLVDSLDPFSNGITLAVRPPKKSWKQIGNLSGGEKTLSSLSLVFALHHYRPTPLYVMDEIDAALDFRNVSIIGHYIKDRTKNAQFVVISLRNNMFELCDRLVGIYKINDCTMNVVLEPRRLAAIENSLRGTLNEVNKSTQRSMDRGFAKTNRRVVKNASNPAMVMGAEPHGHSNDEENQPQDPLLHSAKKIPNDKRAVSSNSNFIPNYRGTRKPLSPAKKKASADFIKFVDRTKRLKEPLVPLADRFSCSPSKKLRSPQEETDSPSSLTSSQHSTDSSPKRTRKVPRKNAVGNDSSGDLVEDSLEVSERTSGSIV